MANEEQVERLKQGIEGWNRWRNENPNNKIDLEGADLRVVNLMGAHLINANLKNADLRGANLNNAILELSHLGGADLRKAYLVRAQLRKAILQEANLEGAILGTADLYRANLSRANLKRAYLVEAYLEKTNFENADLQEADLSLADLSYSSLRGANLDHAILGNTKFGNIDLSKTKGLDEVEHDGPSTIGTNTLERSKGKISVKFLRGCGLSDVDIEYAKLANPNLSNEEINSAIYKIYDLRATRAIQINPMFISYNHNDNDFVDEIEKYLNKKGIRYWRDSHNATAGRLEKMVDRAIRQNPITLLVLSKESVKSDWVEFEAKSARELEKELGRDVLCPIALDDSWKNCDWPKVLRQQIVDYNILDFSKWKNDAEFAKMFRKLIDGLELFYKEG